MDQTKTETIVKSKNCAHENHNECLDCPDFEACPERQKRFYEYIIFAMLIVLFAVITLLL
jgi:hypothetical protein